MDVPLSAEKVIAICTLFKACVAQGAGAWVNIQKEQIFHEYHPP